MKFLSPYGMRYTTYFNSLILSPQFTSIIVVMASALQSYLLTLIVFSVKSILKVLGCDSDLKFVLQNVFEFWSLVAFLIQCSFSKMLWLPFRKRFDYFMQFDWNLKGSLQKISLTLH